MHPRLAVELTDERAGLKRFYFYFRSGLTVIYGENYAFLSLFTKSITDGRMDQLTSDGPKETLQRCEDASKNNVR